MSSHDYKGHKIKVEARPGAARPWGVWVDGVELFGQGDRVKRRLAYGTAAAALDAGKRHVRELNSVALLTLDDTGRDTPSGVPIFDLAAATPCLYCGHRRDAHTIPYETNLSLRCAVADCTCIEFQRPPVQPNLYPCGCSRHKVNAGRCDQYKPGEVP